jgi:hypothetical protein
LAVVTGVAEILFAALVLEVRDADDGVLISPCPIRDADDEVLISPCCGGVAIIAVG